MPTTRSACRHPEHTNTNAQVLATSAGDLQGVLDELTDLGFDRSAAQHLLWECPGLLAGAFRAEQMPLVRRMVESRRAKYTNGGTYAD